MARNDNQKQSINHRKTIKENPSINHFRSLCLKRECNTFRDLANTIVVMPVCCTHFHILLCPMNHESLGLVTRSSLETHAQQLDGCQLTDKMKCIANRVNYHSKYTFHL